MNETLYKLDSKGKIREWNIRVEDSASDAAVIIITAGIKGGKMVENRLEITEGKNLGRANATTPYEQAVSEAKSKHELQLRSGYVRNEADVKQFTLGSGVPAPMLAQKYDPTGKQSGSKTLDKMGIRGQFVHVQPKYDGNRCLVVINGIGAKMYTRKGDLMPVQVPHIIEAALKSYRAWALANKGATPEIILDGELFSEEISFNTLNGILKKFKGGIQTAQLATVKLRLYDSMLPVGYSQRYEFIKHFNSEEIPIVPSFEVIATEEELKKWFEEFVSQGHEGLMIRTLGTPYENKRAWQLVKYKSFEDEEFELVDIEEDARGGFVGAFILKMNTPSVDRDGKPIEVFRAGVSGLSQEEGREMFANKDKYIGKVATVEYFGKSEYGVPRFPKLKSFRWDI